MAFGAFLGLALLKFGNPPIMEKWVTPPKDIFEFLLGNPWPIVWAYAILAVLIIAGVRLADWQTNVPRWLVALPAAWLAWECLASAGSVDPAMTKPTLAHFFGCVVCFYLGLFVLGKAPKTWFLGSLLCAFLIVVAIGWQQHFVGLEQTRRYFFTYLYPQMKEVPPEYLKKLSSNRIFSTLFYPNALAGAILLLLPGLLEFVWQARERFTQGARLFLVVAIGLASFACLYWSGSKGGWLLMLLLGLIRLLRLPFDLRLKRGLIITVLMIGLAGFFWRYLGFFEKGATSVSARFDYWQAATRTSLAHPLFGTGPGTFAIPYARIKRPESEMSRLAHNDYLEQASDSGLPGFILYTAFILGALLLSVPGISAAKAESIPEGAPTEAPSKSRYRKGGDTAEGRGDAEGIAFALWLGALGWALQGLLEFSLYIPALAWTAFAFLGLLLRRLVDKPAGN